MKARKIIDAMPKVDPERHVRLRLCCSTLMDAGLWIEFDEVTIEGRALVIEGSVYHEDDEHEDDAPEAKAIHFREV